MKHKPKTIYNGSRDLSQTQLLPKAGGRLERARRDTAVGLVGTHNPKNDPVKKAIAERSRI